MVLVVVDVEPFEALLSFLISLIFNGGHGGGLEVEQWTDTGLSLSRWARIRLGAKKISVVIQILREALSLIMFKN